MRVHYTDDYLLDPQHLVTVNLIGLGGTGSQVLQLLARLNSGLLALGHCGLHVYAWDGDTVSAANVGRQLFFPPDVGLNKAVVLVGRLNRAYGWSWEAMDTFYRVQASTGCNTVPVAANITITCVDNGRERLHIGDLLTVRSSGNEPLERAYYWLDFGNGAKNGQVVLGSVGHSTSTPSPFSTSGEGVTCDETVRYLPNVVDLFGWELEQAVEDDTPSCSLAEAIEKQDLFINPALAALGMDLLWKLFREAKLTHHVRWLNLETGSVSSRGV